MASNTSWYDGILTYKKRMHYGKKKFEKGKDKKEEYADNETLPDTHRERQEAY